MTRKKSLVLPVLFAVCLANKPAVCQLKSDPRPLSISHATQTTDYLLKQAIGLKPAARAQIFARLARAWWNEDRRRARSHMKDAIQEIESPPNRETDSERAIRLNVVRALIPIAVFMDRSFTDRLESILTRDSKGQTDANANASALIDAALRLVETDPARAAAMGFASLRIGKSTQIIYLLSELRKRDLDAGDRLFLAVLGIVERPIDTSMMASLSRVAFIGPAPSERIRKSVLTSIASALFDQQTPSSTGDCAVAQIATPLLEQFRNVLPERFELVQAAIAKCATPRALRETAAGAVSDTPLTTVDDFLRAAAETPDKNRKLFLMGRAAYVSAQEKDYERAISILDQFARDDRGELNGSWESWRWEFAAAAALDLVKHGHLSDAKAVIGATPSELRAFAEVALAVDLNSSQSELAIELLQDARRGFAKSEVPISIDWYFALLKSYARFLPQDAVAVLFETVKTMNRDSEANSREDKMASTPNFEPISLPNSLLQTDFDSVSLAIRDVEQVNMRIRLNLGLLNSSLDLAKQN